MTVQAIDGGLLDQKVDAIVNAWNRNTIPWWLLLPQGVSGAIRRRGGVEPFREVGRHGRLALGQAVATSAGKLPHKGIIHVAGINDVWRASERSIRDSVRNALAVAVQRGWRTLAFPVLGAGSDGFDAVKAEAIMRDELDRSDAELHVLIVRFRRG